MHKRKYYQDDSRSYYQNKAQKVNSSQEETKHQEQPILSFSQMPLTQEFSSNAPKDRSKTPEEETSEDEWPVTQKTPPHKAETSPYFEGISNKLQFNSWKNKAAEEYFSQDIIIPNPVSIETSEDEELLNSDHASRPIGQSNEDFSDPSF